MIRSFTETSVWSIANVPWSKQQLRFVKPMKGKTINEKTTISGEVTIVKFLLSSSQHGRTSISIGGGAGE